MELMPKLNLILHYRGLNPRAWWRDWVERQFQQLQSLATIAAAHVTLEWQRELKPAFQVQAQLEVPGPDFHAGARDHTLQAALLKVIQNLERQILERKSRRVRRRKANARPGWMPRRSQPSPGGCGI